MRHLMKPAMMATALLAALPAAAQVTSPGPTWGGSGGPIPAPGGMAPRGVPMPPPPTVSHNPPHYPGPAPIAHGGPGVPTAGPRVWQNGRWMALPPRGPVQLGQHGGNRWGGQINGRWYAGAQAPGGWNKYRRMGRGGHLPSYWMGSGFRIPDYLSWGLAAPPYGYFWVRYYDDAVLVDDRGGVWDSVSGISWADADAWVDSGAAYSNSYSYSNATVGAGYRQPIQPVDPNDYYDGYSGGSVPPAGAIGAPPAAQVQGYYGSGQAYYGAQGSYQSGAYYYGAPVGSTVVITMPAATTTTTTITEEVIEEVATTTTYVRSAPRRVVRKAPVKRRYVAKAKCCVCGCR
ncbi:RcnB family protein [Sphingomonas sp. HITSZ_GF]|uniref:RcnB family protein n=1 Tax=Sphingomonas sp. HITSZ_GF TaxID=3037247 RepID=UPI00240DA9BD|nr:RcnB family protein [Sphingomonas sp. HITSZ_GF]MDG2534944.1 RcnB family protein [Sphingomonas sp. HITSZ_GF]